MAGYDKTHVAMTAMVLQLQLQNRVDDYIASPSDTNWQLVQNGLDGWRVWHADKLVACETLRNTPVQDWLVRLAAETPRETALPDIRPAHKLPKVEGFKA